jgi:hypothetical protein
MALNPGLLCCPCCKVKSCLSGDTIDTNCCLSCDELLMWSERPSFSVTHRYYLQGQNTDPSAPCYVVDPTGAGSCSGVGKITHFNISAQELEPVQTVYKFYTTYWRPINFYAGSIAQDLPVRSDPFCEDLTNEPNPKLNRCGFDFYNAEKMNSSDPSTLGLIKTCLGVLSPCAKTPCHVGPDPDPTINPCVGEEHITSCDWYLTYDKIAIDLNRGYSPIEVDLSAYNCCYPIVSPQCDQVTLPTSCECNSPWMTSYRRRKLLDDYRTTWGVDIECHDENAFEFNLTSEWLFNMAFERWWSIGKDQDGVSQSYWNIPDLSGTDPNPNTSNPSYPYKVIDMVPKFWIFACSAAPFFRFELEDAWNPRNSESSQPRQPVISKDDRDLLLNMKINNTAYAEYELQSVFENLSKGGYFDSNDWREEQLQAYKELNQRFPNSGYAPYANKTVDQMPKLGPFRKKLYASHLFGRRNPILRADRVAPSAANLQAEFYAQYPGLFPTPTMSEQEKQQAIDDYYFWAERQWVYFRAVPAGWTWANWNAGITLPCGPDGIGVPPTEDAAILAGCGRAAGNCIESWFNSPQEVTVSDILTNNVCISTEGEGQPEQECILSDGTPIQTTACGCCRLNCEEQFNRCNANCSGAGGSPPNQGCICEANRQNCLTACELNDCRVEYNVPQCFYNPDDFCGCNPTPLQGCDNCTMLSVNPYCGGVHIIATQYVNENFERLLPNGQGQLEKVSNYIRCLWTANTFLTPAKNSYEYRTDLKKCNLSPDTSMYSVWANEKNRHIVPQQAVCNNHLAAITDPQNAQAFQLQYLTVPACESGICWPWSVNVPCCGNPSGCPNGDSNATIPCPQRIGCVSLQHGKQWDERTVCPPSCGTDDPSYRTYPSGYFGGDGSSGGPTESSCERDSFLGYSPECG